ncbi:hypothetical protein TL16_g02868 [Triparma laevis f. inornata]|uniref:Uncharacterized protein n=1 Tax=Triparma laevis f. inornata TaxID=1714386 RepID=A0A9W6ZX83_9STRA|nr:hypothetical protein TL16_g02868 [Triparma laevis f. inornata]
MFARFLALLLLLPFTTILADDVDVNFLLAPPKYDPELQDKALVFFPGGNVPNTNYTNPLVALQNEVAPSVNLHVIILGFKTRKCIQVCPSSGTCVLLHNQVQASLELLTTSGFKGDLETDVHLGGHSLGGTCVNQLVQGYKETEQYLNGLFMWGSYIDSTGEFSLPTYPAPFALIGAELDGGLARPGKMANWLDQFNKLKKETNEKVEDLQKAKAVVIIPGIDHSDFCPGFEVPGDIIPSEVNSNEALKRISKVTGTWLLKLWSKSTHLENKFLARVYDENMDFLRPYFAALDLEVQFHAMHYTGTGGTYSPVCEKAQMILAGLSAEDAARVTISRGCDSTNFEDTRSCAYLNSTDDLEHSRSQYAPSPSDPSNLLVNVSGHANYYRDFKNTGSITAASQIACKMLTGARIAEQLNIEYDATTSRNTCKEVNEYFYEQALQSIEGTEVYNRYLQSGKKICFKDDFDAYFSAGPAWIKESLEIKEDDDCLSVASVKIDTALDSNLFPGVHYCKLLSPARVLDWVMTDSNANKRK